VRGLQNRAYIDVRHRAWIHAAFPGMMICT
jgi:hypothetical protein